MEGMWRGDWWIRNCRRRGTNRRWGVEKSRIGSEAEIMGIRGSMGTRRKPEKKVKVTMKITSKVSD
jgi:hypothetical protein